MRSLDFMNPHLPQIHPPDHGTFSQSKQFSNFQPLFQNTQRPIWQAHDHSLMSPFDPSPIPRSPPRAIRKVELNEQGQLVCKHVECAAEPPTFARKCEWSKHMDKHERPYICREPGCEMIMGFTYAGGLLRHEREVHRKHGGPRNPFMCPFANCRRSTGSGFTRKENLNEHLRRVHQTREIVPQSPQLAPSTPAKRPAQDEPPQHRPAKKIRPESRQITQLLPVAERVVTATPAPASVEVLTQTVGSLQKEILSMRKDLELLSKRRTFTRMMSSFPV